MRPRRCRYLAPVASLAAQRRWMVQGTPGEYLLPSELLEDAAEAVRLVCGTPGAANDLSLDAVRAILDLRACIDAAGHALEGGASEEELVERDGAWHLLREQAIRCLETLTFDLRAWETSLRL